MGRWKRGNLVGSRFWIDLASCEHSVVCIGPLTCNDIDGEKEFKGESGEKMYA